MNVSDGVLRMPTFESSDVGLGIELMDLFVFDDFLGPWDSSSVELPLIGVKYVMFRKD